MLDPAIESIIMSIFYFYQYNAHGNKMNILSLNKRGGDEHGTKYAMNHKVMGEIIIFMICCKKWNLVSLVSSKIEKRGEMNERTDKTIYGGLSNRNVELTLNEVDKALERLTDLRNLLKRTTEGYEFAVTAFPEVIIKTSRTEDLFALNLESFRLYGDIPPQ